MRGKALSRNGLDRRPWETFATPATQSVAIPFRILILTCLVFKGF